MTEAKVAAKLKVLQKKRVAIEKQVEKIMREYSRVCNQIIDLQETYTHCQGNCHGCTCDD